MSTAGLGPNKVSVSQTKGGRVDLRPAMTSIIFLQVPYFHTWDGMQGEGEGCFHSRSKGEHDVIDNFKISPPCPFNIG